MRVLGLDLSLTGTGVAPPDEDPFTIRTTVRGVTRLDIICDRIADVVKAGVDCVVLEDYAYSRSDAHSHEIGELGGCVRLDLFRLGVEYAEVKPNHLKVFATDRGNAKKQEVLIAARDQFGYAGTSYDEADAVVLREMGLLHYDFDRRAPRARMREVLARIAWPVLPAEVMRA